MKSIRAIIKGLAQDLRDWRHRCEWEYGTCYSNGTFASTRARRHRLHRNVQFILWHVGDKQGDHTYTEDFWHDYHRDWWPNFKGDV